MTAGNHSRPVVLLWDLDGTLLTTARAGLFAFEAALQEVCGVETDLSALETSGLTDAQVARLAVESCDCAADPATVHAVLKAYERHLPEALPRRDGHVMPSVLEVLEDLAGRDDVVSLLLTGNTRAGATAKLRHYGLEGFFTSAGAFCSGRGTREEIAGHAVAIAHERLGHAPDIDRVFVIGDSPSDIRCGKAIGARTLAVASGWHSRQELEEHEPWLLLERLPEPTEFRELVGLDGG